MALSHKKLAEKRNRRNQSRKKVKYNPHKRYFDVEGKQAVETTVAGNRLSVETETITL